ncbi:MAG: response regulator transcription factor [Lachnospiraceae bacterium]|nr:response regulator transcription factor [Lachnospiraceae bacterium]
MKIAVCDDDSAAREHIVSLIIKEQIPDVEIVTFAGGKELLKSWEDFAIFFLDPEMKEVSGIDVARQIRQKQEESKSARSIIIFVTNHEKYVYDAFDVAAFQYLIKPVDEEKFSDVFRRAWKEVSAAEEQTKRYILVKKSGEQKRVYLKDIYYIESANKKVIIHTTAGTLESYGKMEELERMLDGVFYRCHRCYLVHMEKIASYNADTIRVANGDKLILARKKYAAFVRQYIRYAKDVGVVNV